MMNIDEYIYNLYMNIYNLYIYIWIYDFFKWILKLEDNVPDEKKERLCQKDPLGAPWLWPLLLELQKTSQLEKWCWIIWCILMSNGSCPTGCNRKCCNSTIMAGTMMLRQPQLQPHSSHIPPHLALPHELGNASHSLPTCTCAILGGSFDLVLVGNWDFFIHFIPFNYKRQMILNGRISCDLLIHL